VNEENNELPGGWVRTTIGAVAETTSGGTPSRNHPEYYGGTIPWVKSGELKGGTITSVEEFITEEGLNNSSAKVFQQGTTLVAMYGATVGKTAILGIDTTTNQAICAIFPLKKAFTSKFILYWLQSQRQALIDQSIGGAQPNINQEIVRALPLPLAPLPEQYRIVAAIEQQFTCLDAGVAALRRAQAKLKRYRAAVLKAAVEGKLTKAWRAEHPTNEPASILLERIHKDRRAKWEVDLKAEGKDPAKMKYVEPTEPDTESLPELPEGWCWVTVEQVSQCIVDCLHSTPKFKESGFLCIDTNCIKPGRIVFEKVRYVDEDTFIERNRRMKPKENDVMFSREGALLGVSVRVPSNLEFCLGQRMMIFRLDQCIDASFYEKVLNSSVFRSQYLHEITGSASPHLNIQDIRRFMIPLPPFVEQQIVVAEVERRLSIVEKLESVTEANLKRAERLRQSILKEAFAGRLVPQDPNDEPASVLLERIRKEREGLKKGIVGNGLYAKVSSKPVQIDVEGTRQVELWEGVGEGG
jgi:type I restriction enzyme, S subunit